VLHETFGVITWKFKTRKHEQKEHKLLFLYNSVLVRSCAVLAGSLPVFDFVLEKPEKSTKKQSANSSRIF
jgi:hypothetical protein